MAVTYANLEQRMAQAYIDMLPSFVPEKNADVSEHEQEQFYCLIKSLCQLAFTEPLLFVPSLNEDDAYPNRFNASSYGKPKLKNSMKKFRKAMDDLLNIMYTLGQGIEEKLNKRQEVILSKLGFNDFSVLPPAWVWMSTRPDSNLTAFSHCLLDKKYPYTSGIYARLLGEKAFCKLEKWMIEHGYQRFDIYNVTASDCKLSLTFADPAWSVDCPNGGFEYKIKHTGISVRYDYYTSNPTVLGLCIPGGLKQYLESFDSAEEIVQKFIIERTKKCDGCKYCIQTDKTGLRPLAMIKVKHLGKVYNLCPYFPGYAYCWTELTNELSEQLIEMLMFMDEFVKHAK